jgi:hypothetical protein
MTYITVSLDHVAHTLCAAPYYVDQAAQVLEEYLEPELHQYVTEVDIAVLAAAMAFDARMAEDIAKFIKAQILDWINSR